MMRRTRLAHLLADGRPGGGSTAVLGWLDALRAGGGFDLTLVSQPGSYLEAEARQRGIAFIGFDFFTSMFDLSLPWRLARRLGPQRFDLTHLHGLRAAHHAVRTPLRGKLGALVYTVHGLHQLHLPPPLRWLANRAEHQVMRRVDARVFVSRSDQAAALAWGLLPPGCDSQVILNGIDLARVEALRRNERHIDVAFIARHVQPKGPELAARVLAALAARGWRCVMAGDGPLRAASEAWLAQRPGGERVQRLGELTHEQALALLARTRVLLMPSLWEGLPLLPMEAMALGVPVVASRLPAMAEVVADGETGLLVTPGDEQALLQATAGLLTDGLQLARMQQAGQRRVRENFDQARGLDSYRQLYERLLQA